MRRLPRGELLDGGFQHHLLADAVRLDAWSRAVAATVRPGDVVADVGSGSGVLAWLALRAGARKVLAVEANTHAYAQLLRHVRANDVAGRVVPILADGTEWEPDEPVDVLVCELMETGLLHEPIAAVMRRVHAWTRRPRAILPRSATLLVEGVETDHDFLGWRARIPGFRTVDREHVATDRVAYARFDFAEEAPPEGVDAEFRLVARRDAAIDALRLATDTLVAPGIEEGASPAYCTPVVLPLAEPVRVRAGDALRGRLRYEFAFTNEPIEYDLA